MRGKGFLKRERVLEGKGFLKRESTGREKTLIWGGGCLFCITRVVCRNVKGRMSPLTNEEYICLTYLKSSSWSVGGGHFKEWDRYLKSLG